MDEHKPVTDDELMWLNSRYFGPSQLPQRAAAEISELRVKNAKQREDLKTYGRHKNRCDWTQYAACICGLDDALKAIGDG